MVEKLSPKIIIKDYYGNPVDYEPEGWMWILAFALHGCEWAVKEAESEKFKDLMDFVRYKKELEDNLFLSNAY